jgi:hypothetical protein
MRNCDDWVVSWRWSGLLRSARFAETGARPSAFWSGYRNFSLFAEGRMSLCVGAQRQSAPLLKF